MPRVLRGILLSVVIVTIVPFLADFPMRDESVALASLDAGGGSGDGGRGGGGSGGSSGGGGNGTDGAGGAAVGEGGNGNGGPEPMLGALPCGAVMKGGGCSWVPPEPVVAQQIP